MVYRPVMNIGILETGRPPDRLSADHPSYAAMIEDLVGGDHRFTIFAVCEGTFPADPSAHEAYVITGSPAGVYEPLPWIASLADFLRGLPPGTKLVGICFGHQIMAAAFGGRVEKSERGWGLGLQRYAIHARETWMDDATVVAVPAIHQDQVVEAPAGARTLAGNAFTPHAILAYADRAAISFQVHPEFTADYATALIAGHEPAIPHDDASRAMALASLRQPNDCDRLGGWIRRFLEQDV